MQKSNGLPAASLLMTLSAGEMDAHKKRKGGAERERIKKKMALATDAAKRLKE